MSCTICRLPFVPSQIAVMPIQGHLPPKTLMSDSTYVYFSKATGIGKRIIGGIGDYRFSSGNLFSGGSLLVMTGVEWESRLGTVWMMHTGCAKIFRSVFKCEDDNSCKELVDLFQVEEILGPLGHGGADHGRFQGVDYESTGEQIDLRPYWKRFHQSSGENDIPIFDYKALIKDNREWMFTRPDVFPKFPRVVASSRVTGVEPAPGNDVLTRQPLDVLLMLVKHVDDPRTYAKLMSTCRYLRYHAIANASFQLHARELLKECYPWAFPTTLEYEMINKKKGMREMVVGKDCGGESDWLLYMCQVHWTKGMRVRRYVWAICEEIKSVYMETLEAREDREDWDAGLEVDKEDRLAFLMDPIGFKLDEKNQARKSLNVGKERFSLENTVSGLFAMRGAMGSTGTPTTRVAKMFKEEMQSRNLFSSPTFANFESF
ncbi:hypothetical protein V5O48_014289 [Marasmius crinis-equi]|uniref:F-box domain-containing protein n=1 Tax=Marasmius crinis-equi TaxID=585013 RepID=A0ABR3EXQ2_9AGAR